jgi:hypothetical protein
MSVFKYIDLYSLSNESYCYHNRIFSHSLNDKMNTVLL